jgi:hypothetical protein
MHTWLAERALLRSVPRPEDEQVEAILAAARDCFHTRDRPIPAAREQRIADVVRDLRRSFPTVLRYALDDEIADYWLRRPDLSGAILRESLQKGPGAIASSVLGLTILVVVFGALIGLLIYASRQPQQPKPWAGVSQPAQSFATRCDEVLALDGQHALLTPEQRETLKLCRAALHDTLHEPESKLGLKPPRQVEEPERPQPPR